MIETGRLVLRKPGPDDSDIIQEILSSQEQTRFLPNEAPYSPIQQSEYLKNRIEHWAQHGFGTFILCLKDDTSVKVGFAGVEYAPDPEYVDVRFGIAKEHEGLGYTTEATERLVEWVFRYTGIDKIFGVCMPDNHASKAVLKKLGMVKENDVDLYQCSWLEHYSIESNNVKQLDVAQGLDDYWC